MKSTDTFAVHRLLKPLGQCLTLGTARRIVELEAPTNVQERVETLAEKCQAGTLTADEFREYEAIVQTGTLIELLQAEAQVVLDQHAKRQPSRRRNQSRATSRRVRPSV